MADHQRVQRKLAAIMVADVVGYSRLMEFDEQGTRERLNEFNSALIYPRLAQHDGRIVKTMGDGLLVEFSSAVDAVQAGLLIQDAITERNAELPEIERLIFRVGINVGDVIVEGDDLHGDGINIAARLERLCDPGAVFVSGNVRDQVAGKIDASFDDLGEQNVKNIARPIRVFMARFGESAISVVRKTAHPVPLKPSIAVMPFKNLSGDPEQDTFVEGLRLAIQATMVQVPGLFMLAPPAVAKFQGTGVDAGEVARKLGVRFVLEGAAQRSEDRIRVTVQLTDTAKGQVVWAERYDRPLADTLAVQDEITFAVVFALEIKLVSGETLRAVRGTLTDLDALNAFYRGLNLFYARSKENNAAAQREFEETYRRQSDSSIGPAFLAMCHWFDAAMGWTASKNQSLMKAVEWAEKAIGFENNKGMAYVVMAGIHLLNRRHDEALASCHKALDLRSSCPIATATVANVLHYCGYSEEAATRVKTAMRLMHIHPPWFTTLLASAYREIGELEQAIKTAAQAVELNPKDIEALLVLCSSYSQTGQAENARRVAKSVREADAEFSLSSYSETLPYRDETRRVEFIDSLKEAGLPA